MSRLTCPSEILEYINKAAEYDSKGMHAEQVDQLEEAVRICPDSAVAHHNLGAALANLERYDEAEKEFCQAIELAPQNAAQGLAVPVPYMQAEENLIKLRMVRIKEGVARIEAPRLGALVFVSIGVALAVCVFSSLRGLNGDMQSAKIIATSGYLGAFILKRTLSRGYLSYFTVGASIWVVTSILLNVIFRESIGGLTDTIVFSGINLLGFLAAYHAGSLFRSWARAMWKHRTWDFFFSYKSENANEVRHIAERLMAAGYRVWFAEYEVVLRNYEEFQREIRKGTQNCSFAILFTTKSYSQSKHCCDEVTWLKQRLEKEPWRIIEVSLEEPNNARQALGLSPQSPRLVAGLSPRSSQESDKDRELLTQLARLTGLNLDRDSTTPQIHSVSNRFRARCAPISFDPSGFVLNKWRADPADGTDIVSFEGEPGPVRFGFNVYFHFSPQVAPGQPFKISNDRGLYHELRAYASQFMSQTGKQGVFLRERGLHLIWINGRTQFALTHSFLWVRMRKYSVILSQLPQPIQLIFTFGVTGSFEDFYRLVPLMDRVIESIRVEFNEKTQ